jgi:hypothetical protein
MTSDNKRTYVSLTGGLGNQLFQLAAGLYLANGRKLQLLSSFGMPRLNSSGEPEISNFSLPINTSVKKIKKPFFLWRKSIGLVLRLGVWETSSTKNKLLLKFFLLPTNILSSIILKKITHVYVNKGVGYWKLIDSGSTNFLIGYFQTYKWASESKVYNELYSLQLKNPSVHVTKYKRLAIKDSPLIVHIRLGDYRKEKSIGLLSMNYYASAVEKIWDSTLFKKIWLFSDEPAEAEELLNSISERPYRVIPENEITPAEALEVMRYGRGYVIANSTYSWWGAFLSYTLSPPVIAPNPWFQNMPEPLNIIPERWSRLSRW